MGKLTLYLFCCGNSEEVLQIKLWTLFDLLKLFFFFGTKASASQFPVIFVNYGFKIACLIVAAVLARPQKCYHRKSYIIVIKSEMERSDGKNNVR